MNEIRCSECGSAWLVEGSAAEELQCPTCLRPLAPATAQGGISRFDEKEIQEIVCPRCQLHFYPSGRHHAPRPERRPRILVVEDQEYFRKIASETLEELHYEVLMAANVAEARAVLRAGDVDLLVLDLTLEGEPGRELMAELDPKPCPILIFTAQDEREFLGADWEELKRLGADDVVVKGMQVAESLARKVGRLLGRPEGE